MDKKGKYGLKQRRPLLKIDCLKLNTIDDCNYVMGEVDVTD